MNNLAEKIAKLKAIDGGDWKCGYICDEVGFMLYSLVKMVNPDLIIQTGHLWGKSALIMLEALTDGKVKLDADRNGSDPLFEKFLADHAPDTKPGRLISIDPEVNLAGIDYLQKEYPDNFIFFHQSSDEFFYMTSSIIPAKRIMGFVDGDHDHPEGDIEALSNLGAKVIVIDDTTWLPKIGQKCEQIAKILGYFYINLPTYNGLGIMTKSGNFWA